jgi:hypothetical protein
MRKRISRVNWSVLCLELDTTDAFLLGATVAFIVVLSLELWLQGTAVEQHIVDNTVQTLRGQRWP